MLQIVELPGYTEAKEYVFKQARVLQKEKDPKASPRDLAEGEEKTEKKKVKLEDEPNEEDTYTHDELLAWIGKGPGKGGKGLGKKGSKGQFEGRCHYCGTYGHCFSECRKKDADMKRQRQGLRSNLRTRMGIP